MKHLVPSTSNQTIEIIPRVESLIVTIKLRDDSTNTTVTILPTAVKNKNYIELTNIYDIKEGRFYDLKVYNGQGVVTELDIIYRDKIFCTAQSIDQSVNDSYKINKDTYTAQSTNNDFIIL